MKKLMISSLIFLVLLVSGCGSSSQPESKTPQPENNAPKSESKAPADKQLLLTLSTGPANSGFFVAGAKVTDVVRAENPNINISNNGGDPIKGTNSVASEQGDLVVSYEYAIQNAREGKKPFEKKLENLRALVPMGTTSVQIFVPVKSKLKTLADLKDKRISVGSPGTSLDLVTQKILAEAGLSYDIIRKNGGNVNFSYYDDASQMMKDGLLDAIFVASTVPASSVKDLDLTFPVRLLSIGEDIVDKYIGKYPGFYKTYIKSGSYRELTQDEPTVTMVAGVYSNTKLTEDTAYQITKAFWKHIDEVKAIHPLVKDIDQKSLEGFNPDGFHPGALKYYKEAGLIK